MSRIAIRTDRLTRDFESVRALDDLSFEVEAGTVFGFLGPNGSGKTTTIRLLLGLLEPSAGNAEVLGFDIRTQADQIRLRTGALLEHPGLYERLSAEDNLDFYGRIWRIPEGERKQRMRELLGHLDLWDRRADQVGTWSRGMRQKLAVARVLLHRPALIFLDEPTAGLDPVASAALREDLANLAATEGVTVFITTHNLAEAEKLCQRVGVIRNGRLIAIGDLDELHGKTFKRRVEIVTPDASPETIAKLQCLPNVAAIEQRDGLLDIALLNGNQVAPIVSLLVASGARIEEVRKVRASLEDTFLTLVADEAS